MKVKELRACLLRYSASDQDAVRLQKGLNKKSVMRLNFSRQRANHSEVAHQAIRQPS